MTGQPRPQLRSKVRIRRRHPTAGPIEPAWGARTSAYQQLSPRRAASGKDSTMRNASHTTGWEPPPTRSTHRRNGYTSRPVEADVAYRSPRAARALGFECRQPAERVLPAARLWDARARLVGLRTGCGRSEASGRYGARPGFQRMVPYRRGQSPGGPGSYRFTAAPGSTPASCSP